MTKNNLNKYLLPVGVLLAFASMANATVVAPGAIVAVPAVAVTWSGAAVADTGPVTLTSGTLTATIQEQLFKDTGAAGYCAGCLDWVINASDTTGDIGRITAFNFGGTFITDVGYIVGPGASVIPVSADRSTSGAVVGFNFQPNVNPGFSSVELVIRTNSTTFVAGNLAAIDGFTIQTPAWGVAPEPNMACLLSVFAVGILGVAYRRKKSVVKNTEV